MAELLTAETAISPVDGRYWSRVNVLSKYFSEAGWMRYRVLVEGEYFASLRFDARLPELADAPKENFRAFLDDVRNFDSDKDCRAIKRFEAATNHDIKAVEYFVKEKAERHGLSPWKEFVHFGLTSQDINNTAMPMAVRDALLEVVLPALAEGGDSLLETLKRKALEWIDVPMLARTHGQPATPTRIGKELMVFVERLQKQVEVLKATSLPVEAKFGGATGQFNAHVVAYPDVDWPSFADAFLAEKFGLKRQQFTTQIEHYDGLATMFDALCRVNTVLLDFCRDFWTYVSMDYFRQKVIDSEVGSSAMPHKVNPIDFENAEGNLGVANALFGHLARKLPVSRLQRDLTDSTVLRNAGVAFAHALVAVTSIKKGFSKLVLNQVRLHQDLDSHWAVVSEAIQTILRRERYPNPYEALKSLTRGEEVVTKETLHDFVDKLEGISEAVKRELKAVTPFNYIGAMPRTR